MTKRKTNAARQANRMNSLYARKTYANPERPEGMYLSELKKSPHGHPICPFEGRPTLNYAFDRIHPELGPNYVVHLFVTYTMNDGSVYVLTDTRTDGVAECSPQVSCKGMVSEDLVLNSVIRDWLKTHFPTFSSTELNHILIGTKQIHVGYEEHPDNTSISWHEKLCYRISIGSACVTHPTTPFPVIPTILSEYELIQPVFELEEEEESILLEEESGDEFQTVYRANPKPNVSLPPLLLRISHDDHYVWMNVDDLFIRKSMDKSMDASSMRLIEDHLL